MGLDPALQEAGGHREPHRLALAAFELHAREPARINVIADLGAKSIPHARPTLLIRACHSASLFFDGWMRNAGTRKCPQHGHHAKETKGVNPRRRLEDTRRGYRAPSPARARGMSAWWSGAAGGNDDVSLACVRPAPDYSGQGLSPSWRSHNSPLSITAACAEALHHSDLASIYY